MDLNFKRALDTLKRAFGNDITKSNLDLVLLLSVYIDFRIRNLTFKGLDREYESAKNFIYDEIKELVVDSPESSALVRTPLKIIIDNHDFICDFVSLLHLNYEQNPVHTLKNIAFNTESAQSIEQNFYQTPTQLCRLTELLFSNISSARLLDMNANYGEWSEYIIQSNEETITNIHIQNTCLYPFHYLVNQLSAKLRQHVSILNEINSIHEPKLTTTSKFDCIFANPPFGKIDHSTYEIRGRTNYFRKSLSKEGYFLTRALDSVTANGKIAFIVPLGFLFRKDSQMGDYELRKQLTQSKALKVIIELPEDIFTIKTALLLIDLAVEHSTLSLISLNTESYNLTSEAIEDLRCYLDENQARSDIADKMKVNRVSFEQIVENDFDWQSQTYQEKEQQQYRKISEIKLDIANAEVEILQIRANIEEVLDEMEKHS